MYRYQFLPHTADISLFLQADTLDEIFLAGLAGISQILKPGFCSGCTGAELEFPLRVESIDPTTLLIDFLSEVLTLSYLENGIFCKLNIMERNDKFIEAVVKGCKAEFFDEDIKAVTYHEAEIRQRTDGQWVTPVIFDI